MPGPPPSWDCTVRLREREYEHRGATVEYEVYVDPDGTLRQVVGGVRDQETRTYEWEDETHRLEPNLLDRARSLLTEYEFTPVPEHEHVQEVTAELEAKVDHIRDLQEEVSE